VIVERQTCITKVPQQKTGVSLALEVYGKHKTATDYTFVIHKACCKSGKSHVVSKTDKTCKNVRLAVLYQVGIFCFIEPWLVTLVRVGLSKVYMTLMTFSRSSVQRSRSQTTFPPKMCFFQWRHTDQWFAIKDHPIHIVYHVADAYEVEFHRTLAGLANRVSESVRPVDRPPDAASVWCRKVFSELQM